MLRSIFLLLAFYTTFKVCHGQYIGGPGHGSARAAGSINLGTNIFMGGSNDGETKNAATINLGDNIYSGGSNDGVSRSAATTDVGTNIFKGGSGDGIASIAANSELGANIYKGGTADGVTKVASNVNTGTNIYTGGSSDGWAMVAVSNILLPVTLTNFTGTWQADNAYLSWRTSSEINSDHFEIERSFDGGVYTSIASIKAAGTGAIAKDYNYNDADIKNRVSESTGIVYYRLKTIDKDGRFSYSAIVVLKATGQNNYVYSIYPNPAKQFVTINMNRELLDKNVTIRLADQNGRILFTAKAQSQQVTIETSKYANGMYYVQLIEKDGTMHTQKLIVNK